ncbi:RNA-directed DNA polymerase (reverse transcriptase)-related family protein [Rhynchospora pubera]|uniref:RNA-directed DNA polymerase (Reverse transcriptase)-related family protein n=1 Tax=Rhynchospora pubera TaxID=906938 RepID=A0AAV8FIY1_9POAL|nr:RNA-directed DNA polymerase (reverse transcriptase)-related family protein [Rhynchospora pubera]
MHVRVYIDETGHGSEDVYVLHLAIRWLHETNFDSLYNFIYFFSLFMELSSVFFSNDIESIFKIKDLTITTENAELLCRVIKQWDIIYYNTQNCRNMHFMLVDIDINSGAWKWTSNGIYSTNSAYHILSNTGVTSSFHPTLWKIKAPPRVKIFLWLLILDRLLTQKNLLVRGWPTGSTCPSCNSGLLESSEHLFLQCHYATNVWSLLQIHLRLPFLHFAQDNLTFCLTHRNLRIKNWDIIWAATTWKLWKARNKRIFQDLETPPHLILKEITACIGNWTRHA